MIEDILLIKISNGWIITIRDKGMVSEHTEDVYLKDQEEIIAWVRENIK